MKVYLLSLERIMIIELVEQYQSETNSLEKWVDAVYLAVHEDLTLLRRLYRFARSLFKGVDTFAVYEALSVYAHFDCDHQDTQVATAAKALINQLEKMRGFPDFIAAVKRGELAGFIAGDLLYVTTTSVKPDMPRYQMTTFARGRGPISDALRNAPEDFTSAHFGLPSTARFISQAELFAIEREFYPVKQAG